MKIEPVERVQWIGEHGGWMIGERLRLWHLGMALVREYHTGDLYLVEEPQLQRRDQPHEEVRDE